MPRASALMLNAATTAATLFKDQAPRGFGAVSGFVSWVASLAWRWQHLPLGRRRVAVAGCWVIGLVALAVVIAGPLAALPVWAVVLAWLLVGVGALLAAGRLALFNLKRRTRRAAIPARAAPPPVHESVPVTERTPA